MRTTSLLLQLTVAGSVLAAPAQQVCSGIQSLLSLHPAESSSAYSICGSAVSTTTQTSTAYVTSTLTRTSIGTTVASTRLLTPSPVIISSTSYTTPSVTVLTTATTTIVLSLTSTVTASTSTTTTTTALPIQCLNTAPVHARAVDPDCHGTGSMSKAGQPSPTPFKPCSCLPPVTRYATITSTRLANATVPLVQKVTTTTTLPTVSTTTTVGLTASAVSITSTLSATVIASTTTVLVTTTSTSTSVVTATPTFQLSYSGLGDTGVLYDNGFYARGEDYNAKTKLFYWVLDSSCHLISGGGYAVTSNPTPDRNDNAGERINGDHSTGLTPPFTSYVMGTNAAYPNNVTCTYDLNLRMICANPAGASLNGFFGDQWTLHNSTVGALGFDITIVLSS